MLKYLTESVFFLLSFDEGFGLVLTEALYLQLPIVASTNTGAEDILTDAEKGYIVPVGDHVNAAEKIINIMLRENYSISSKTKETIETTWATFCEVLINKLNNAI